MAQLVIDAPVLRIEGLELKYDIVPASGSLELILGSALEAKIVQQLHFWTQQEASGILYKGAKWIYKSVREWIEEVLPIWSRGQVNRAIASLVNKGVLIKAHLFKKHHGHNYDPKNRTLYYSLVYKKLQELAETTKLLSFHASEKTDFLSVEKQISRQRENNTEITPKENNQKKTAIQVAAAELEKLVQEKPLPRAQVNASAVSPLEGADGKEKGLKRLELPKIELNPVNSENNSQSEAKQTNPVKDQKALQVDEKVNKETSTKVPKPKVEKINNPDWRSHKEQLEKLGVPMNKTVISLVKLYKTEQVEKALAVFKNRKEESNIANPAGYFVQALKQGWGATKVVSDSANGENTVDTQAVFRCWYDLARELGYCADFADDNGEKLVNMNGSWEAWESAIERGYTLEYLQKVRRRD